MSIKARDVVPYEWGLWCSVEGREPFANTICHVQWSKDGKHLWFGLDSHNHYKADPDEVLELVPEPENAWRVETRERRRSEHAEKIAARPRLT